MVHQDGAVMCTTNECGPHLARTPWFSLHKRFGHCADAVGGSGCQECGFTEAQEGVST
jgi:hypothetical protein